jgi:serine/threonine protein kinase
MANQRRTGEKIPDRWEIFDIKRGGMGIVYIVYDHHPDFREAFAAKTFHDEVFSRNPLIAKRFINEAHAWINLDIYENITQASFVQEIDGKPYIFLEYVSGGDLSPWIGTPRLTNDLPQVLRFAIQFCDGMIHANSKGIKAHRDIKPQNCLITEDRTLKITDFGLAKIFENESLPKPIDRVIDGKIKEPKDFFKMLSVWLHEKRSLYEPELEPKVKNLSNGLTHSGKVAGTPMYMAPEQFDNVKHVDVRADIYSFGIMLFEMVTGKLPFIIQARTKVSFR